MKRQNIDREWKYAKGQYNIVSVMMEMHGMMVPRYVNLPHDAMIETDVDEHAIAGTASGFYNASTVNYSKMVEIPSDWADDEIYLLIDGAMMSSSVDVNGSKVGAQHFGYVPKCIDITNSVYPGQENRIIITTHPGSLPNSRWYPGSGVIRSVELLHGPKLHIVNDGIYAYTADIEYDDRHNASRATIKTQVEIANHYTIAHTAVVEVSLIDDETDEVVISRKGKLQINPGTSDTAYVTMTVDAPKTWNVDTPNLYRVKAVVTDIGEFKTHEIENDNPTTDESEVLFGIRTVTADVNHGLRINGETVKLKGGCLHHDNGMLGAVSLYDAEYRKLSHMKAIGYNAIRTTHNPPSKVLMEAAARIGMYVFDEAFDAWDIAKVVGDYNVYFENDWQKDLAAFMKRDRSNPAVVIWSTGNEIPERGGLDGGYARATEILKYAKTLDETRPISNAICSYWSGLDDAGMEQVFAQYATLGTENGQNADMGKTDTSWEEHSWAFTNGLDIVGYNYMENKYLLDHEMYPERVILGSENYGNEIGIHWPMIEETPYVIGDFTWTAYDYIGEAAIGQCEYMEDDDPRLARGPYALSSQTAEYPWRTANDADFDLNGELLPQGAYRSVVWGSEATHLYTYDPDTYGKQEMMTSWGFTRVQKSWNYSQEGKPTYAICFTGAEEVELLLNGKSLGRKKVDGVTRSKELPKSVLFELNYEPGELVAVSYRDGKEVSRDKIETTGKPATIRLTPDNSTPISNDGHGLSYVLVEIVDDKGRLVPDASVKLHASVEGSGFLAAFGTGNPKTEENYTTGEFHTYQGKAMAIIRNGYDKGDITITVEGDNIGPENIYL